MPIPITIPRLGWNMEEGTFVEWLKARVAELQVDIRLNTRATVETIRALAPDAVVVATGAIRRAPDIEGKDLPHVHDGQSLRALLLGEEDERATGKATLTQRVAMGAARVLGVTNSADAVLKASKLWMPVGDRVVIVECRPLSRDKRWRVARVLERGQALAEELKEAEA